MTSVVALTAFLTIADSEGNPPSSFTGMEGSSLSFNKFQNGKHEGVGEHKYLSFIYQGAAMSRAGDNLEASLILANSPLSMSYVKEIVEKKYYVYVETYLMTNDFDKDVAAKNNGRLTAEYWLAAGMNYDVSNIELILSSAIDAISANAPKQTLTRKRCSHLPLTGSLQNV